MFHHVIVNRGSINIDVVRALRVLQSCKAVYDRIIDLRIATPQIVINYGMFLNENNYFEEAFKVQFLFNVTSIGMK
jgi:Tfp pilus assembly protein PilF